MYDTMGGIFQLADAKEKKYTLLAIRRCIQVTIVVLQLSQAHNYILFCYSSGLVCLHKAVLANQQLPPCLVGTLANRAGRPTKSDSTA